MIKHKDQSTLTRHPTGIHRLDPTKEQIKSNAKSSKNYPERERSLPVKNQIRKPKLFDLERHSQTVSHTKNRFTVNGPLGRRFCMSGLVNS